MPLKNFLCRRAIEKVEVHGTGLYPNYEKLRTKHVSSITTEEGELYVFRICQDTANNFSKVSRERFLRPRYLTVEIISNINGPMTINYKNKIMLAVKVSFTFVPRGIFYRYLMNLYIETLDKTRREHTQDSVGEHLNENTLL